VKGWDIKIINKSKTIGIRRYTDPILKKLSTPEKLYCDKKL